ncbi:hypothetical protein B0J14DRAFT_226564 [Halenospora varia]|nr:hypothetical protein B0J14DRAFT_226564 [Halenospora varia]
MATNAKKRKAAVSLEHEAQSLNTSLKKLKVDRTTSEASSPIADDDDDGSEYDEGGSPMDHDDLSENENGADTPLTPFSPRKKFPSEFKNLRCTFPGCNKTFNRPVRLQTHIRSHTNERPCICPYEGCDKSYLEDKHLQRHVKGSHMQEKAYVCEWEGCGKAFLTGTRLRRHIEAHEGKEKFRCTAYPPCNKTFRKHQTLQRHIRSDHLELAPFPCTFVDPVTNIVCEAGFDGAVGLRKHMDRVHSAPKFTCNSCTVPGQFNPDGTAKKLGFISEAQLKSHNRKEHANCLFCDLKCASQRELQKHIETQHSGKSLQERKNILCTHPGCDKAFTKKSNLTVHVRTAHNGERFICGTFDMSANDDIADFDPIDSCGKDFVSKVNLEDHIRVAHLGLPSIVNANRKDKPALPEEMDEDAEFVPKKINKKKKPKQSADNDLTGNAYFEDPRRTIPCQVLDCKAMFIREYDLQLHMETMHTMLDTPSPSDFYVSNVNSPAPAIEPPQNPFMEPADEPFFDGLFTPADLDWELQQQATAGGPFWIGADNGMGAQPQDQNTWMQDEAEMRALIGDVDYGLIDPNLLPF